MFLWYGAGEVWAEDVNASNIIIDETPTNGTIGSSPQISGRKVTLTIQPDEGYYIKASDIIVEPLVDMNNANARRRVPEIAEPIVGKMFVNGKEVSVALNEATYVFTLPEKYAGAYVTATFHSPTGGEIWITGSTTSVDYNANGHYILADDVSASVVASLFSGSQATAFTGTFEGMAKSDGTFPKISGLSPNPLFATTNGATIKNVILDNVNISSGTTAGNVGAVCCEATGSTRIYNCGVLATKSTVTTDDDGYTHISSNSSTVSGSKYVGGIVGLLDGSARVINCFSYANITGGSYVGGIVGYNNVATTSSNLKTMVMNCMFYGDITGGKGTNKAPIYNGTNIVNKDATGVGNYNYFYGDASYVQNRLIDTYNCALMAETRFLQRFEFFRHLLNSHRELAAWWATDDYANKDEMAKWVLLPSQIGTSTPYPVLAKPGYYPSVVNIDAENATTQTERNKGGLLGTLYVTIRMGSGGAQFAAPPGASITTPSLPLNITDKDPEHFNFNYKKVQLPYYNDVGTKNYTGNRVVTGWKIVSITGGTEGSFSTGTDATVDGNGNITATPYNFADRNCTAKDLYSETNKRVFNQGAYWDVPEGVTAITIEPYWAKAAYLADPNADKVYNSNMSTAYDVPNIGGGVIYKNGSSYNIAGESQVVFTDIGKARDNIGKNGTHTVYDYAIVLVGNAHNIGISSGDTDRFYTLMSADFDADNEPDYSYILRFNGRAETHPVRVDFLNIPGLGMAQKSDGGTGSYNFGIMQPIGWFESTNTSLFRVTQFEYDRSNRGAAPLILQGGVMEQWVSGQNNGANNQTTYFHVGGNVWFKEFHRGTHQDKTLQSKHPPISVTGGDFDEFYLTGLYRADVKSYDDNAECYINGGRFGVVAGTGMEGIGDKSKSTGNIVWQIQNADIKEFYGGGINAAAGHIVEGSITTNITGGKIDQFCGGPKFGDMNEGRTVVTTATGSEFGTFFGAGYGGNSYSRRAPTNQQPVTNIDWNSWVKTEYTLASATGFPGISTQFNYQFLPMSDNTSNVARLFVEHVTFSLATTQDVTSTLTDCTITGNFYGGGSLGKVAGPVTSTLTNCKVSRNVYGAGYSASLPTVEVDSIGFRVEPYYYTELGTYRAGVKGPTTTYTWKQDNAIGIDKNNHILYTTENLSKTNLGSVSGAVTLTITGSETRIGGSVYGGGEESAVNSNTTVSVANGTIGGSVYGGGALANTGNTEVNLTGGVIEGDVYGGGRGTLQTDAEGNLTDGGVAATVGSTLVELNKGLGDDDKGCVVKGSIFGCNNLNGTPTGSATVHIYATQHADKTTIADKYGIAAKDESVTSNRDILGYWITQAEKNKVAKETLDAAKAAYNNSSATDEQLTAQIAALQTATETAVSTNTSKYDVIAVYGGGNLAAYKPHGPAATTTNDDYKNTTHVATVIIDGCGLTSIRQVYGGGNAASTPATSVTVNGTYEIEELFGGGNGKDDVSYDGTHWFTNPGANVGYVAYSTDYDPPASSKEERKENFGYGTGKASVNIYGGTIHRVFGGSNTKGNVSETAVTMLEDLSTCKFCVDEAYGGGKSAPMDAEAQLLMSCIPGLTAAYGGAEAADIQGNVVLNITNGTFDRVFGGNNKSGTIKGSITVNVEETGCKPIIIGELYGGGNLAGYSVYGYQNDGTLIESGDAPLYADPQVNVRSFTSIGNIYGGGYGANAIMVGNPTVNINVVNDATSTAQQLETADFAGKTITIDEDEQTEHTVTLPAHEKGKMGAINNVYGGGNAAKVIGNTYVNIGTEATINFVTKKDGEATPATGVAVQGADIRGNVYGGGNQAEVTGDTHVQIGKKVEP